MSKRPTLDNTPQFDEKAKVLEHMQVKDAQTLSESVNKYLGLNETLQYITVCLQYATNYMLSLIWLSIEESI